VVGLARKIVISIPDDVPKEWLLGQIETIILRWKISRVLLREIVEKSELTEKNAEEIGGRVKALAWEKLKKRPGVRD